MLTQILYFIDAVMNRIRQQNRLQPCFAKQEEFAFFNPSLKTCQL